MRATARTGRWCVAVVLGALLTVLCVEAAPASAAPSTSSEALVPVYVVQKSYRGAPENVAEIAQRFLGSTDGAARILQANADVRQADGSSIPATGPLRAGWVLVMPASATGPGLQVGQSPTPPVLEASAVDPLPWVLCGAIVLVVLLAVAALWWFVWRPRRPATVDAPLVTPGDRDWWLVDRVVRVLLAVSRSAGIRGVTPYLLTIGSERVTLSLSSPRSTAPVPFRASGTGTEWYVDVRDVQDAAVDPAEPNPLSTLVTVGEVDGDLVVLDLALAGGVVQLDGDPTARRSVITAWGRQLRNAPWADASLPVVVSGLAAGAVPESEYTDGLDEARERMTEGGPLVLLVDDLDRRDQSVLDAVLAAPGAPRAVVVGGSYSDARWTITVGADGQAHSDLFGRRTESEPDAATAPSTVRAGVVR